MSAPVQLLVVEDNQSDINLLLRLLSRSGMVFEEVVSDDLEEIRRLLSERSLE